MKLALGTAQFGLDYGVANKHGRVEIEEVRTILSLAKASGIMTLDTASAYGQSEKTLGKANINGFDVISKIPPFPTGAYNDIGGWIREIVNASLTNLRATSLRGLLFHRPMDLLHDSGKEAYQTLVAMKAEGVVEKIGISIYQPEDLDELIPRYSFDIIQAPLNILDRRLISSGWLQKLKCKGIEVHTRSAFLQGLLLMNPANRPAYFLKWAHQLNQFDQWRTRHGLTALQACLGFLDQNNDIDRVIVGIDSSNQLEEIIKNSLHSDLIASPELELTDEALINPSRWQL
ncbi:aldo/keto reductase [Methylophaga nitratireducenticrescens]|uniref:aldo/keto reductase n=1 Tax=Methylophaga nitratireducenticrescens TaxID=754476 RepID=UPI000CDC2FD5|nr:aldo/keto reductase [Methylophaga nitratireducenticrescens]AUZ84040.1 aldo/keto reductase [Methylophaga nitratireducenticrescens]